MSNEKLNAQIYDEASRWFIEFRTEEPDSTARKDFHRWLRTSPEHVRAYLELAAIWNEGARLDPDHHYDLAELKRANVIAFGKPGDGRDAPSGRRRYVARIAALAASVAIVAIASLGYYSQRGVYTTSIGERRSMALSDGSRVEMNAGTKIREVFARNERRIKLLRGQALFHVAKSPGRPFIVETATAQVRAVGTQFDVYQRATGTTVTVIEGTVAILEGGSDVGTTLLNVKATGASGDDDPMLLVAGEQALVTAQNTIKPTQPNVAAATAWTQGRLVFEATPLTEVAEEFNRYNKRRLVIQSPVLNDFQITGMFSSTDPATLIRFLRMRPNILVIEKGDQILVAEKI